MEEPYCSKCGNGADYITLDGLVEWDVHKQDWVVLDTFDNWRCSGCEADLDSEREHLQWRPLNNDT